MRIVLRPLLLSAIVVACFGILDGTASGYVIPKRAVFEGTTSNEWEDWGFWTSRLNGSELEFVTPDVDPGGADPRDPVLSPNGLQIAFKRYEYKTGQTCLEVTSVEGGRAVPVYCSTDFYGVTWSPNGNELAFSGYTKTTMNRGILVFDLRTEELRIAADWIGPQDNPTFSPNGSKIAFDSVHLPSEKEEVEPGLWVVNSNGTEPKQLTGNGESEPDWSPDGTQLAAYGYFEPAEEEPEQEDEGAIVLVNSSTGSIEKWLLHEDFQYEWRPRWSPDGDMIYFSRWIEEGPFENEEERFIVEALKPDGTERHEVLPEFFWAVEFNPQKSTSVEPDSADLLQRYEPRLHYDLQEQYFADSAAEATDGPENRILASDRETIVAAHEVPYALPTLATLEEPAASYGVIDEGSEYAEDAATMHTQSQYADKAYGRIFHDETTGADWLDYWFYYYYDDQEFAEVGVHEGDWEHVAYRLDNRGVPDLAVYSRHGSETAACEGTAIGWEVSDGTTVSPKVYVANASHANYFAAGEYNRPFPRPTDQANGDGATATPSVTEVDSAPYTSTTAEPQWFYWNGYWGASDDEDFHSPGSPARDGNEWEDMQAWAEEHEEECEVEGAKLALRAAPNASSSERQLPRPSAPSLSARRSGNSILVHYNLANRGADASYILLTVTARNKLDAARSKKFSLKTDRGAARLPLPLADGPFIATAGTFTAKDERSEVQVVDVLP
jgi:Vacuolar protein sorting-associated protein 62/WD40-like Beta Propeller Repeat